MAGKIRWMVVAVLIAANVGAQQISIPRIDMMPDFPQPYLMRDWKSVAQGYDSLVFDQEQSGQYLPLVFFRRTSVNYPEHASFGLHTAVGTASPGAGEAINVIPAVVGASLSGIDKTNQFGQNWVLMCEEYFNKRPAENIYLNHPVSSSGNDWWYETMPNVFFLQLNALYPNTGDFNYQVRTLADQWLTATVAMGGSATPWNVPDMNYRAWYMATMTPLETGVKEPEAAGAIAWILYNAYLITGERKYLIGAEWNLEFLNAYEGNPSYELQLPYGVYAAARLNAEAGTQYSIEKMVNWCFNRGELRGWGTIVGTWGNYDCSGLVGEANDNGNDYAFAMNGYEQVGALVPMVRYDDRFATAIAKWVLNLANASRLFYPDYLPDEMQDNEQWAQQYDPESYIGYESMKERKNNQSPYATGDAIDGGWAETNLMLYSSSHVGILGGIIEETGVEAILCIDLLKTDYYHKAAYPTYLYYNPYDTGASVGLTLPAGSFDLYDAIANISMNSGVSGSTSITIPPKQAVMVVQVPSGSVVTQSGKKTLAGNVVIDFNNGITIPDEPPRIKALAPVNIIIAAGTSTTIYCTASDPEQELLTYEWTIDGQSNEGDSTYEFQPPAEPGIYQVLCKVTDPDNQWDTLSTSIEVVEKIMDSPQILSIEADPMKVHLSGIIELQCIARDINHDTLSYVWSAVDGNITASEELATYTAPDQVGNYFITCVVSDTDQMTDKDSIEVMVRDISEEPTGNLIAFYPLNGNAQDVSGYGNHGIPAGITWAADQEEALLKSAQFNGLSSSIRVPNSELLNFQEALSIAGWIMIDQFLEHEQHPVSHGSWQHRYKISIGDQNLRFTVNSSDGIRDLDSKSVPATGQWYHLAVVYNGADMEIWLDGKLDAFTSHSGLINATAYDLVFGQNLPGDNNYNFKGKLDAVSIFDYGLSPAQIKDHMENSINVGANEKVLAAGKRYRVFPNPVTGSFIQVEVRSPGSESISFSLSDLSGKQILDSVYLNNVVGRSTLNLPLGALKNGIYMFAITGEGWTAVELILVLR